MKLNAKSKLSRYHFEIKTEFLKVAIIAIMSATHLKHLRLTSAGVEMKYKTGISKMR